MVGLDPNPDPDARAIIRADLNSPSDESIMAVTPRIAASSRPNPAGEGAQKLSRQEPFRVRVPVVCAAAMAWSRFTRL